MPLTYQDLQGLNDVLARYGLVDALNLEDVPTALAWAPQDGSLPPGEELITAAPFQAGRAKTGDTGAEPLCVIKYGRPVNGSLPAGTYLAVSDAGRVLAINAQATYELPLIDYQPQTSETGKVLITRDAVTVRTATGQVTFQPAPAQMWTAEEVQRIRSQARQLVDALETPRLLDGALIAVEAAIVGAFQNAPFLAAPTVAPVRTEEVGLLLGVLNVYAPLAMYRAPFDPAVRAFETVPPGAYVILLDRPGNVRLVAAQRDVLVGREEVQPLDGVALGCFRIGSWNLGC
jgi:hypothetical protein